MGEENRALGTVLGTAGAEVRSCKQALDPVNLAAACLSRGKKNLGAAAVHLGCAFSSPPQTWRIDRDSSAGASCYRYCFLCGSCCLLLLFPSRATKREVVLSAIQ